MPVRKKTKAPKRSPRKRGPRKASTFDLQHDSAVLINMLNHIGDDVVIIREDGQIVYVNDAAVKSYGYPRKYILSKKITHFIKNKMSLKSYKQNIFNRLRKKNGPQRFTIERVIKGGKVRTIEVTSVYVRLRSEDFVLCVARDITERIRLQSKLQESENLYRKLAEEAGDAICTVDLKGKITYANKAQARLLRVSMKKLIGSHFREYLAKDSLARGYRSFSKVSSGQEVHDEFNILDSRGNVVPVDVYVIPLYHNGKVSAIHSIVRDISRRKKIEELKRESEVQQALIQFVSGVAQEIKYPLSGIYHRLKAINEQYKNRYFEYIGYKEYQHILRTIETIGNQVKYCFDTTNRLVNLNRSRVGIKGKKCDINKVIRDALNYVDEQFMHPNTKILLRLAGKTPPAAMSEIEFRQVIIGVLTNAVQSMPGGGSVVITTKHTKNNDKIRIHIKDQGIGIRKEHLSRIFEPFFSTKQRGLEKSSGLGLSIIYSIIQAHRGTVAVESNLRKGTLVKVELPIYRKKTK